MAEPLASRSPDPAGRPPRAQGARPVGVLASTWQPEDRDARPASGRKEVRVAPTLSAVGRGSPPRIRTTLSDLPEGPPASRGPVVKVFSGSRHSPRGAYAPLPTDPMGPPLRPRVSTRAQRPWRWPVFQPETSCYVFYWDLLVVAGIALSALWTPYEVVFCHDYSLNDGRALFDIGLTVLFLKDMILQFFMAHPVEIDGTTVWVTVPAQIVKHYCFGWFAIDAVSCFPFFTMALLLRDYVGSSFSLQELQLLRLVRLFRIRRLGTLLRHWQFALGLSYGTIALVKCVCFASLLCHWMSCIWGFLALNPPGGPESFTWLTKLEQNKDSGQSYKDNPTDIYVAGLYWAVMTLTSLGYGDITAANPLEYKVCTVFFVLCGVSWAYIIGSICSIIGNLDPLTLHYQRNMDLLNIMMDDYHLDTDMRKRLRRYFAATKSMQRQMNQKSVIEALSPGLQGELSVLFTQRWLDQVWYLSNLEEDAVTEISRRLLPMVFCTGETLQLRGGRDSTALFIIMKGVAGREGHVFIKNSVVGDDVILCSPILRRRAYAVSITFVEVMYLKSECLEDIRDSFPAAEGRIRFAQVRWAVRRGFILAAWRIVRTGASCGPRTTAYFQKHIPSFSNKEVLEEWCKEPWEAVCYFEESAEQPEVVRRVSRRVSCRRETRPASPASLMRLLNQERFFNNDDMPMKQASYYNSEDNNGQMAPNFALQAILHQTLAMEQRLARMERRMSNPGGRSGLRWVPERKS